MSNIIPISEIATMAEVISKSGFFGMKNIEQAMALMLIAQAEGKHPATAAWEYNVIQNKPALKADAMMARFQAAGGKVEWIDMTDLKVSAKFSHPSGGSVVIDWDMARAKAAGLGGKDMWTKFPRQMLRARVISEGIRTVFPGVAVGVYTPEEVQDFVPDIKDAEEIPPSPFKNAALRNQFTKNVIESYKSARNLDELKETAALNSEKFDAMKSSKNEHDELALDEMRKAYAIAKSVLGQEKFLDEQMEAENEIPH